jgi:hypothetical protein
MTDARAFSGFVPRFNEADTRASYLSGSHLFCRSNS